jgi:hypothetical protein
MSYTFDQICRFAQPFERCGLTEMLVVGILLYANAIACAALLARHIYRSRQARAFVFSQPAPFWISLALWQAYRGTTIIFFFEWTPLTYRFVYQCMSQALMFISNCFVILLLFHVLFSYRNPGTEAIGFFRILLFVSLVTFVGICIIIGSLPVEDNPDDADEALALWCATTELVSSLFVFLPAKSLIQAVTYPAVQQQDRRCVSFAKVCAYLYPVIYLGRAIWNFTHYCGINALQNAVYHWAWKAPGARAFQSMFILVFDVLPGSLSLVVVDLLRAHNVLIHDSEFYSSRLLG